MKKMKNLTRRCITLIEIMIVMFLIAMITGVVAYNYTGTLEQGKAFKTKAAMDKIKAIIALETGGSGTEDIKSGWEEMVSRSPLANNPKELVKDGWGVPFVVEVDNETKEVIVKSAKYEAYMNKQGNKH